MTAESADIAANGARLIVVLGMHRSGTSALTRGLKALGVELGDHLFGPDVAVNAKGYWEDADVTMLNERAFEALGRKWHSLEPLPEDFVEQLEHQGLFAEAMTLLCDRLDAHSLFGFKDPRVSILLPFWQRVFLACDVSVGYVLTLRNPLSVGSSLAHRDGFAFEKSALLWLAHCVSMVDGTRAEKRRVLVDYDLLLSSPQQELLRIAGALGLELSSCELGEYQTVFLDRTLRHSERAADDPELGAFLGTLLRDFYGVLHEVASGRMPLEDPQLTRQLDRAKQHLVRWARACKLLDAAYLAVERTAGELAARDRQLAELQSQMTRELQALEARISG